MKIKELLDLANKEYPDNFLSQYYDSKGRFVRTTGDTLAEFIVREIIETYKPTATSVDQLRTAIRVMLNAQGDIQTIIDVLTDEEEKK